MKKTTASLLAVFAFAACVFSQPLFAGLNDQATTDLLTSAPWRISGASKKGRWSFVRVFNKDGTFTTNGQANDHGHWRIIDDKIFLDFADGHHDTVSTPLDPKGTAGTDSKGNATLAVLQKPKAESGKAAGTAAPDSNNNGGNPAPGAFGSSNPTGGNAPAANQLPPSSPISPEMQQKAADLIKTYHNSLVFVTGKEGAGSGFIATMGKSNFLFTNAHVEAGINDATFKTLDDDTVKGGQASVAVGRDIVCMAMPAGGAPLEIMQDVGSNAGIGDEVAVLGNAEGGGVVNAITGKIVGVGPDRIEIDAPFVPGNSGSPIIHLKTGKVIGVATYLTINNYDTTTNEKNAKPVIRRFGYRLDNVKQWQGVNWTAFHAQAAEMDKIGALTDDLYDFFRDISENKGSVTPDRHTNPVIKNRINEWIANKGKNQSTEDQAMADENFLSFLKVACESDVATAKRDISYDYFQRELADQQQTRDEMAKAFDEIIKSLRN